MPEPILIKDWQLGIADSPLLGFADMRCVDPFSEPGVLKIGFQATKESSTTVTSLIVGMTICTADGVVYGVDKAGDIYSRATNGTWTKITTINSTTRTTTNPLGTGIAFWKDYIFVSRKNYIDVLGPISGAESWTNGWFTFLEGTDTASHPILVGQDDLLYSGDGRCVASVLENSGQNFAPGTAGTYTQNTNALDLPEGYRIKTLAELGISLMIGTWKGVNIYDLPIADIFPWDRNSDSFDLPIKVSENGVNQLFSMQNTLFVCAGTQNRIYVSNGSTLEFFKKIPQHIYSWLIPGSYVDPYPQALSVCENRLLFAPSAGTSSASNSPKGVWGLNGNGLIFETQLSCGAGGQVQIGCIFPIGQGLYLVSWFDGASTYGVDIVGSSGYRVSDATYATAYVESQLYTVGTKQKPVRYSELELQLDRPLTANQGVQISYRKSLADSFTALATFTDTMQSHKVDAGSMGDIENVQFKIAMTTGANSSTSPRIIHVKIF